MSRIQPLPDDAAAQIQSSRQITSLNGVVLALLENSLDAGARKVDITVHFHLGSCTVDDDGHGIHPDEFADGGGLLQPYHTSSAGSPERLGYSGLFLASLSALSLLGMTSRHGESSCCSHLSVHQGHVVARCIPATPAQELELASQCGTRVSVRDLFGNMPVRVKQRASLRNSTFESNKLWEELTYGVVASLLAWPYACSIKLHDASGGRRLVSIPGWYPGSNKPLTEKSLQELAGRTIKADLRDALPVLYQAGLAPRDSRSLWVPVFASTSRLRLKGLICLQPAPTKRCQFISYGPHPLTPEGEAVEIYAGVNRQFSTSDFGTFEYSKKTTGQDDGRVPMIERSKSVNRWPMFVLNIEPTGRQNGKLPPHSLSDAWLESITAVVYAAVSQWLQVQQFRPLDTRRGHRVESASPAKRSKLAHADPALSALDGTQALAVCSGHGAEQSEVTHDHALSRIRRGQRSLQEASKQHAPSKLDDPVGHITTPPGRPSARQNKPDDDFSGARDDTSSSLYGDLADDELLSCINPRPDERLPHNCDDSTVWTDPATRQAFTVDPRTGNILADSVPSHLVGQEPSMIIASGGERSRPRLGMPQRQSANGKAREFSWLRDLLDTWDNPVFPRHTERAIPSSIFGGLDAFAEDSGQSRHGSREHQDHLSAAVSTSLSKDQLSKLKVIQQVDGKFILCKVQDESDTLILVDQHAASERVILERLLTELCTPARKEDSMSRGSEETDSSARHILLDKALHFQIAAREMDLLRQQSSRFARWGIFYGISRSKIDGKDVLIVRALPVGIAERCRLSPHLLIDLLRTEIWRSENTRACVTNDREERESEVRHPWVNVIGSCPKGIIGMLNSRACRSAIMFNDVLTLQQCEELLADLAQCAFPFMCAHGRVSMVPLIELPSSTADQGGASDREFRGRIRHWMKARVQR